MPFPGVFPVGLFSGLSQAFPVVQATNFGGDEDNNATAVVTLPASIASGDLLIIMMGMFAAGTPTLTTPSGWTELYKIVNSGDVFAAYYRTANGSEGASVNITMGGTVPFAYWNTYRITGQHSSSAPEGATATGSSTTPDPPSLTPSWGSAKTLWLAGTFCVNATADLTAPTNYTGLLQTTGSVGAQYGSARRNNETATENPGTFANADNNLWEAATIAIRPA